MADPKNLETVIARFKSGIPYHSYKDVDVYNDGETVTLSYRKAALAWYVWQGDASRNIQFAKRLLSLAELRIRALLANDDGRPAASQPAKLSKSEADMLGSKEFRDSFSEILRMFESSSE